MQNHLNKSWQLHLKTSYMPPDGDRLGPLAARVKSRVKVQCGSPSPICAVCPHSAGCTTTTAPVALKLSSPIKLSALYYTVKRTYSLEPPPLFPIRHLALLCTQCNMKSFSFNISDRSLSPMLCPTARTLPCCCWNISLYLIKRLHPLTFFFFFF